MDFIVEPQESGFDKGQHKIKRKLNKLDERKPKKLKFDSDSTLQSKSKLSNAELYKPPTVEELNQLRETEILFSSNLFRLQTEELLKEISVKEKRKKQVAEWIDNFKETFNDICEIKEFKLSDVECVIGETSNNKLKTNIKSLAENNPLHIKTDQNSTFKILRPKTVIISGLYNINAISKPVLTVTLNIVMPKNCFHEKDYLNCRYIVKRSLYLSFISMHLKDRNLASDISYNYLHGNKIVPILKVSPKDIKHTIIHIHVIPEENSFKLGRFEPEKRNLRVTYLKNLYTNIALNVKNDSITPFYNSVILYDLTLELNDNFRRTVLHDLKGARDGIILLKIWLDQRGLCNGFGGFNEELIYSCVAYLAHVGKINKHMSSYQVIRNVWSHLAKSTWETNGISHNSNSDLVPFHKNFDVVFIDRSGCFNLAANLNLSIYLRVRQEAISALNYLDDGKINAFQSLFITKMPFYLQYDAVINIQETNEIINIFDEIKEEIKINYLGFKYPLILNHIISLLKEGLSDRISSITPILKTDVTWNIEEQKYYNEDLSIQLGINFNYFNLYKVVEKGPEAYDPKAEQFRKFWGDRAELRRFKDGAISEAVYWPLERIKDKRLIFKDIISFVLKTKLNLKKYSIISDQFDIVLNMYPHTGIEEANLKIVNLFDELGKKMRGLKLPLDITAIQGISEAFSYSDAFPPTPTNFRTGKKITFDAGNNILLKNTVNVGMVPKFVDIVEGVIQMALHSKWPNDYKALCHLKTAFYIHISEELKKVLNIKSNPKHDSIDILYNGLVFRLTLFHPKQMSSLKKQVDERGITSYEDTETSTKEEQKYIILPRIMGALNGLHAQYPSYGPSTALIKRWINCQLLDDSHIPNIVINLLNASLYLNSAPFVQPALPQLAFLRFLNMLKQYDWTIQSVIVNFNSEISKDELDEHESYFQRNRTEFSPLHIITPYDNFKSLLSRYAPTTAILNRLRILATECLSIIEKNINYQNLFDVITLLKPNYSGYNVLIHLRPLLNPRRHENLDHLNDLNANKNTKPYVENNHDKIPVANFNPVDLYLKELRSNYGDFALFFHDNYGGNKIAVLWKPSVNQTEELKIANIGGKMLSSDYRLQTNIDAIIEDFYILGNGLVKIIEKNETL